MTAAEASMETARMDLSLAEANLVRAGACEKPLAVPFKQMALDASRETRKALERFEREIERELFGS